MQGEAIAYNLREMFGLRVPIISVVIGEGGSGGALAIGCANKNLILENSVYYVASPEACAAILWKSRNATGTVRARRPKQGRAPAPQQRLRRPLLGRCTRAARQLGQPRAASPLATPPQLLPGALCPPPRPRPPRRCASPRPSWSSWA